MSTPSSSSSSSSEEEEEEDAGGVDEFDAPSHSRQRFNSAVWPEPFLEALAIQIAIDAAHSFGRLAVAPALANIFQVHATNPTLPYFTLFIFLYIYLPCLIVSCLICYASLFITLQILICE